MTYRWAGTDMALRNALEHARVICALGLSPGEALVQITAIARAVVPADFGRSALFDGAGSPVLAWNENPLNQLIVDSRFAELSQEPVSPLALHRTAWRQAASGLYLDRLAEYHASRYFALCDAPSGVHWLLDVMFAYGGPPRMGLMLARGRGAPPFTRRDRDRLLLLAPHVVRALEPGAGVPAEQGGLGAVRMSGEARLTRSGRIEEQSPAFLPLVRAIEGRTWDVTRGAAALPAVCRAVLRALPGRGPAAVVPPRATVATALGRIAVEATLLLPAGADPGEAAADPGALDALLRVTLFDPPGATAAARLRARGLSPVQTAVGVRLALGRRLPDIARQLGMSGSAAEDARRKLYLRLGVNSAAQLASMVWGAEETPAAPIRA